MGASGLFLVIFLIMHLAGNLLLLADDGGEAFNAYARFMSTNWVIRVLEIGLFLGFVIHIVMAALLTRQNRKARPVKYAMNKAQENSPWYSRNMGLTGSLILVFLVIHLKNFFVESRIFGQHNMYGLVKTAFQDPLYVGVYLLSFIILGLHLSHGFQSAFQSWGLNHKTYTPLIKKAGYLFAVVIPSGFAVIPIFFYIQRLFLNQ